MNKGCQMDVAMLALFGGLTGIYATIGWLLRALWRSSKDDDAVAWLKTGFPELRMQRLLRANGDL